MPKRSMDLEQILIQLVETPLQIAALRAGLTESQLQAAPCWQGRRRATVQRLWVCLPIRT